MMDPVVLSIIGAIIGAGVAALGNFGLSRIVRKSAKTIILKEPTGKQKIFELAPGETKQQITEKIRTEMELERTVKTLLDTYLQSKGGAVARPGKYVDFIAEVGKQKIGVEVKGTLGLSSADMVRKYLAEESGLSKIVFLTLNPVSREIQTKAEALEREGKVAFVVFSKDKPKDEQVKQIGDALASEPAYHGTSE